jgi:protein-disulfide isomerase
MRFLVALVLTILVLPTTTLVAQDQKSVPQDRPQWIKGNPKAAVTLVEYGSAACSHCGHWYNTVWPEIEKKYLSTGKVKYIFREIATQHIDYPVYMLGRCAAKKASHTQANKAYFTVVDGFWLQQKAIFASGNASEALKSLGAEAGLSPTDIDACFQDAKLLQDLQDQIKRNSEQDAVQFTPTFFINGRLVDGGTDAAAMTQALDAALKRDLGLKKKSAP